MLTSQTDTGHIITRRVIDQLPYKSGGNVRINFDQLESEFEGRALSLLGYFVDFGDGKVSVDAASILAADGGDLAKFWDDHVLHYAKDSPGDVVGRHFCDGVTGWQFHNALRILTGGADPVLAGGRSNEAGSVVSAGQLYFGRGIKKQTGMLYEQGPFVYNDNSGGGVAVDANFHPAFWIPIGLSKPGPDRFRHAIPVPYMSGRGGCGCGNNNGGAGFHQFTVKAKVGKYTWTPGAANPTIAVYAVYMTHSPAITPVPLLPHLNCAQLSGSEFNARYGVREALGFLKPLEGANSIDYPSYGYTSASIRIGGREQLGDVTNLALALQHLGLASLNDDVANAAFGSPITDIDGASPGHLGAPGTRKAMELFSMLGWNGRVMLNPGSVSDNPFVRIIATTENSHWLFDLTRTPGSPNYDAAAQKFSYMPGTIKPATVNGGNVSTALAACLPRVCVANANS
jgi:hypothetical protein